jgi:hypothetical protein
MKIHSAYNSFGSTQGPSNNGAASFKALATALQNGDLSGAQTAFAALQKNRPQRPASAQDKEGTNPVEQDFNTLQTALQKGDLSAAQQAFSSIQQDFQKMGGARGHHHHHGGGDATSAAPATTTTDTTATPTVDPTATSGTILNTTA